MNRIVGIFYDSICVRQQCGDIAFIYIGKFRDLDDVRFFYFIVCFFG